MKIKISKKYLDGAGNCNITVIFHNLKFVFNNGILLTVDNNKTNNRIVDYQFNYDNYKFIITYKKLTINKNGGEIKFSSSYDRIFRTSKTYFNYIDGSINIMDNKLMTKRFKKYLTFTMLPDPREKRYGREQFTV